MTYRIIRITDEPALHQAFDVRRRVFVEEQRVPVEIEIDMYDHAVNTTHVLVLDPEGNAVGTARYRPYHEPGVCKVERVAVVQSLRGLGLGRLIMEYIESEAKQQGFHTLKLNAQLQACGFYERLGYQTEGEVFVEADIEHVAMRKFIR